MNTVSVLSLVFLHEFPGEPRGPVLVHLHQVAPPVVRELTANLVLVQERHLLDVLVHRVLALENVLEMFAGGLYLVVAVTYNNIKSCNIYTSSENLNIIIHNLCLFSKCKCATLMKLIMSTMCPPHPKRRKYDIQIMTYSTCQRQKEYESS